MQRYNKRWEYWKAEVVLCHIDRNESRFHKRYIFDVISLDTHKRYTRMRTTPRAFVKSTLPKVGDVVLMKYCKHKYGIDDKIQESRILKTIKT